IPGLYTAKLTVNGKSYTQSFTVNMDPRVKTSTADLQKQLDLSLLCYENRKNCTEILKEIHAFRSKLQSQLTNASLAIAEKLSPLEKQAAELENAPPGSQAISFGRLNNSFASLFNLLQGSDMPPTNQAIASITELKKQFELLVRKWAQLKSKQ
ncbi:MAG TPA: hypothetical protein VET23_05770, partial [Chitinophagaceae bacterium]|nr:hypothetical protein [Chitinophagaceae bacterium]